MLGRQQVRSAQPHHAHITICLRIMSAKHSMALLGSCLRQEQMEGVRGAEGHLGAVVLLQLCLLPVSAHRAAMQHAKTSRLKARIQAAATAATGHQHQQQPMSSTQKQLTGRTRPRCGYRQSRGATHRRQWRRTACPAPGHRGSGVGVGVSAHARHTARGQVSTLLHPLAWHPGVTPRLQHS